MGKPTMASDHQLRDMEHRLTSLGFESPHLYNGIIPASLGFLVPLKTAACDP